MSINRTNPVDVAVEKLANPAVPSKELQVLIKQKQAKTELIGKQAVPTTVTSKQNEINTAISDLTTLQSQHCMAFNPHFEFQGNIVSGNSWATSQEKAYLDHQDTINMIERYVKRFLFKDLKFISDPKMLDWKGEKKSVCQIILSN